MRRSFNVNVSVNVNVIAGIVVACNAALLEHLQRPRTEVHQMKVAGHAVDCRVHGQWRNDYAIGKRDASRCKRQQHWRCTNVRSP